jgi:3-isopropylmalate dehydratase small subunit
MAGRHPDRPKSIWKPSKSASPAAPCRSTSSPEIRHRLLEGLDDIALTLKLDDAIARYRVAAAPVPVTTAL